MIFDPIKNRPSVCDYQNKSESSVQLPKPRLIAGEDPALCRRSTRVWPIPDQCGQIQKIGWESRPNTENFYILQKLRLHPYDGFAAFKSLT